MNHGVPPKKRLGAGARIALIILGTVVVLVVGMGIFAFVGMRKFLASAKIAEARNSVAQMAKDAQSAYEASADANGKKHLCASSTYTVPASMAQVRGTKYLSQPGEWRKDATPGGPGAGFACLEFEIDSPQYYRYSYVATATGFTAAAQGDLDGDGVFSRFETKGTIVGDSLVVAPGVTEDNPEE